MSAYLLDTNVLSELSKERPIGPLPYFSPSRTISGCRSLLSKNSTWAYNSSPKAATASN